MARPESMYCCRDFTPQRYTPEEDDFIRRSMTERLMRGEKPSHAAMDIAKDMEQELGIKRSYPSILKRWYVLNKRSEEHRDETLMYLTSLAKRVSVLERHISEQDRLIRSLLRQIELATRCIAVANGGDAE